MKSPRTAMAAAAVCALLAAPAAADTARNLAAACANCHGTDGRSQGTVPSLAGQNKTVMLQSLRDFRDGKREATIMHQLAKGYTDEQLELMTDFFSRQAAAREGNDDDIVQARVHAVGWPLRRRSRVSPAARRPAPAAPAVWSSSAAATAAPPRPSTCASGAPDIDVTLVEREAHSSRARSAISCWAAARYRRCHGGLRWSREVRRQARTRERVAVDPDKRTVRLASGETLNYDRLILSPGIDFTVRRGARTAGAGAGEWSRTHGRRDRRPCRCASSSKR